MTIKDYAKIVLEMNDPRMTAQAIAKLEHGVKHEEKWNQEHRYQVGILIDFLKSGNTNIEELNCINYQPVF